MSNRTLDFDFQDHLAFALSGIYEIPFFSAQNQIQQLQAAPRSPQYLSSAQGAEERCKAFGRIGS
jgi:hypothetical protein